jgi:hypothetical protein
LAVQILDHARQHGRVTMGETIRISGASHNMPQEHFRNLAEKRRLMRHGTGKGFWCALP